MSPRLGLVLTGGGARGAYQAGVLRGISDAFPRGVGSPFRVVAGVSTGAINAAALGCSTDDFATTTEHLWQVWADLRVEHVFRADLPSIFAIGARWGRDLASGGLLGPSTSTYLLDTSPLRELLTRELDLRSLRVNVSTGALRGFAVSATNYGSGTAVSFFDAHPEVREWTRSLRVGRRTDLRIGHVMASAAIPLFFPAEPLDESYWADGCIRLTAPLSPAIHLGADELLAIGIARPRACGDACVLPRICAADIVGVLLNAVLLDALEGDFERMQRINRTIATLPEADRAAQRDGLRWIPVRSILPSADLGLLAAEQFGSLPRTLRHMLRGLGASEEKGWNLLSYLAFERGYTRQLLELGRADARANAETIAGLVESAMAGPRAAE